MPLTKETQRRAQDDPAPPALGNAISALIAAAEPHKPPTEDEILSLILEELVHHNGAGFRRPKHA